jgi:hypothetical protein
MTLKQMLAITGDHHAELDSGAISVNLHWSVNDDCDYWHAEIISGQADNYTNHWTTELESTIFAQCQICRSDLPDNELSISIKALQKRARTAIGTHG